MDNDSIPFIDLRLEYRKKESEIPATEISSLSHRFPKNIKLFAAYKEQLLTAGIIVYENRRVVQHNIWHQTVSEKESAHLNRYRLSENLCYCDKEYLDFGISTEMGGAYLNRGLATYKEGFGA